MTLSRQWCKASSAKETNIKSPRKGCRMRVQGPPPNRLAKKYRLGWKKARPDSPASTKLTATTQWVMRSLSV
jgi:hypothetical protein